MARTSAGILLRLPVRRVACGLICCALLAASGCDSDAKPREPSPGTQPATQASAGPDGGRPAATRPTIASTPPAADPGGCMAAKCHDDLLATAYRHAPIHSGACDVCHQPEQPDHKFPLKRAGSEACTFCHPVMGHAAHAHQVITSEGCTPCHDPHGSNAKFLLTRMSTELVCQQCHSIQRKSHLHGPFAAGECTACHQPHESDNRFLLRGGEGKDHCLLCHRDKQQQLLAVATVHKPVQEGCTGCHEAHSSDNESMLNVPVEELCFKCHDDVEGRVADAKSPHGAVFTGHRCANCHDPHAEGRRYLLRDDLRTLCLQCHDRPQKAYDGRTIPDMRKVLTERKSLHGPVQSGQCDICHEVHGSRNVKLLAKYFPPEFYQAFDLASYALCFECHSKAIVLEKQTTSLTSFRDGDRNLHYLHVNRPEKGRTCRTCHEIHGSNLPRHMAAQVQFEGGGWPMPIRFEETPGGGRCSPGCHQPYEYNRLHPSSRPSTRPSGEKQR